MNKVFHPRGYFTVPDGTDVSAFLNATDITNHDVPWGALGDMSVAAGRIQPRLHSWVHFHPAVTQITYLVAGTLTVRMKDATSTEPYDLPLCAGSATAARPGTLFQLRNDSDAVAEALYLVSPSYVFETDGDGVKYDDAILVARTWEELSRLNYDVPALRVSQYEARARRLESMHRLGRRKGSTPQALVTENICSLKREYDYLAPDGSEIRLLVTGEHGGLAHCVLPAGKTSAPVQHRTVEELWYVLGGTGEIWRRRDGEPSRVDDVKAGDSVRIPVGVSFQFRASQHANLELLLATMPPWPGVQEEAVGTSGGIDEDRS